MADGLFHELKKICAGRDITMKELIEASVQNYLERFRKLGKPFKLRDQSFKGDGLTDEFQGAAWSDIRKSVYSGHGE